VARRRLRPDLAEDVVQEALRIIVQKGVVLGVGSEVEGEPALAWCFQVLRHTIGNAYRRQRARDHREAPGAGHSALTVPSEAPTPIEALHQVEATSAIRRALDDLAREDPGCGRYFARLLEGLSPAELALEVATEAPILYRRIYRCRQKLRALLLQRGVEA
jgi:RNA polymerase sigma factor (sigma-70 family)